MKFLHFDRFWVNVDAFDMSPERVDLIGIRRHDL